MSQYLDLKGPFDLLAPPAPEVGSPLPVAVVAQLGQFASEVFEARAIAQCGILTGTAANPAGRMTINPVVGGGIVIEELEWDLPGGPYNDWGISVYQNRDTVPPFGVTGTDPVVINTGSTPVKCHFEAPAVSVTPIAMQQIFPEPGSLAPTQRIFVPPGGQVLLGRSNTIAFTQFNYRVTIREIPTIPKGL